MLKLICVSTAIAMIAGAAAPAAAQAQATPPAASQPTSDTRANEIVCQKQEVTGSRLGVKRICKTRAEWADAQLQDRQEVDRVQSRRGMKGE